MTWEQGRAWVVLQYSHCAHDTAKLGVRVCGLWVARARERWALGRWALGRWARGMALARAGGEGHGTTTRPARWPGRAGWAKLGHCAPDPILTQFLDSVLFLSQFMDTVHEPGS